MLISPLNTQPTMILIIRTYCARNVVILLVIEVKDTINNQVLELYTWGHRQIWYFYHCQELSFHGH